MLDKTRQAGAGHVDGRPRTLRFGAVFAIAFGIAVRVHVPVLSVFAIAVHGESYSVMSRNKEKRCETQYARGGYIQTVSTRAEEKPGHTAIDVGFLKGLKRELRGAGKYRSQDPLLLETNMYHGMGTVCTPYLDRSTRSGLDRSIPTVYPTELHFNKLVHGRVSGSSKWFGLTRNA